MLQTQESPQQAGINDSVIPPDDPGMSDSGGRLAQSPDILESPELADRSPGHQQSTVAHWRLTLLCWNIQGLEDRRLWDRTVAAIDVIKRVSPDVVFLQEVVLKTHKMLSKRLLSKYYIFPGDEDESCHYFASMLLKKEKFQLETELVEPFLGSQMGRNLIIVKAKFHGIRMKLLTSHIESRRKNYEERNSQLKTTFSQMRDVSPDRVAIFGADTNAKDEEIARALGGMTDIHDVWEALGSSNETEYTWDMSQNDNLPIGRVRIRYDRLLYHQQENQLRPVQLDLVGKRRLPCGMFISDHWGVLAKFNVRNSAPPSSRSHVPHTPGNSSCDPVSVTCQ